MSTGYNIYVLGFIFIAIGAALSFLYLFFRKSLGEQRLKTATMQAKVIVDEARRNADAIRKEGELAAKDLLFKMRQDFEKRRATAGTR